MRTFRYVSAAASAALFILAGAITTANAAPAALGSGLKELTAAYELGDASLHWKLATHLTDRTGNPLVRARILPGASADAVLAKLTAAGFHLVARSEINRSLVEGYLPLASVREAATIPGIGALTATHRPIKRVGLVTSQAVALEKANLAQARGFDGKGIKIGALSDSYDACPSCSDHPADNIASDDLPEAGVTVLEDLPPGTGSDEGRAMLQLIHDIAPGSQLGFATAFISELDFANNILALRAKFGADVIVDDVFYTDEPMFSDGILAQAVNIVSQQGAAYFSSAGNNGLEAWEDTYRPISFEGAQNLIEAGNGDNVELEQIPPALRPVSFHNFNHAGKASIVQHITTADGNGSFLNLQWDEPFNLGKVQTDYNIYVFDENGNWLDPNTSPFTFNSFDDNIKTDQAVEFAILAANGTIVGGANVGNYQIVIGKMNHGPARHLKYIMENTLAVSERQNAPSTGGHAAANGGRGVAATYYAIPSFPEDFSSPGPVTIYFDDQGNRLARPEIRLTPQLTAADGVDTTFFGFDSDGNGFPNFFGTSAAAPDAAAVAALVLQAAGGPGSLNPRQLYDVMEDTATPMHVPNVRWVAGAEANEVAFSANKDWTRFTGNFTLAVEGGPSRKVHSITFDAAPAGLNWSKNPNRFSVSDPIGIGVDISNMTRTVSADGTKFTITFAPGTFVGGNSFDWGMSVFSPLEGFTTEDPDRFRGMKMTVVLEGGHTATGTVFAMPKLPFNNFTGAGLVNADAATRAVHP
jgi:Subtilase family